MSTSKRPRHSTAIARAVVLDCRRQDGELTRTQAASPRQQIRAWRERGDRLVAAAIALLGEDVAAQLYTRPPSRQPDGPRDDDERRRLLRDAGMEN